MGDIVGPVPARLSWPCDGVWVSPLERSLESVWTLVFISTAVEN